MSEVVSFKVPREIKEKMRKYANKVNWSALLREFLMEKIRLLEAEENLERVRKIISETSGVPLGFSSKSVREDRNSN